MVADLVGDYLFTDKAFVQKLSTENRNVFQKIWDEIKYLCKTVTAGSKEARQLLEVKKIFEEAYRAETKNPAGDGGSKYSLLINHTDGTVEELSSARNLTDSQVVAYLKQARSGTLSNDTYVPVRSNTPAVILNTVRQVNPKIEDLPMVMQVKKAKNAMRSDNRNRKRKYGSNVRHHGLSPEVICEIIKNLDDPQSVVFQTNRVGQGGKPLPDNFAVFVEYSTAIGEGVAIVEFDSSLGEKNIGPEDGDVNYHTVVTVFDSDVSRDGFDYDYVEDVYSNPNNRVLDIINEDTANESAIGQEQATDSTQVSSKGRIASIAPNVKTQFSLSSAENVKAAEQHFGITYKISEAGYLLTDGRLLDFSGRHEGGPGGYRTVDHRDITDALGDDYGGDSYSGGMIRFMGEGNIRLSPESGGINLSVKPNKTQLSALDRYITNFRGEVMLDIDDANGNTVVSIEYPKRTYSKRIINDINAYFDNGTMPEQPSSIGQFLSLSEQNQADTDSPFPLPWQIKGQDVALEFPLPPGYQEQGVTANADMENPPREALRLIRRKKRAGSICFRLISLD